MSDCVVLTDGSLAGLVALAIEAERAEPAPLVLAGHLIDGVSEQDQAAMVEAVRAQATAYGAAVLEPTLLTGGPAGHQQSSALLTAAQTAARKARRRLVWAVQFAYVGSEPDLDVLASTVDRALLVSRLASLDLWDMPDAPVPEVRIETPLLDLSDQQIVDLAADMSVPWETVWWLGSESEGAKRARARWETVLEEMGLAIR